MSILREFRSRKNWTQAELARRAGISRSSIAAIENGALVPSVNTALALASALDRTVEELFSNNNESAIAWAWEPSSDSQIYWEADFDQKRLAFPVEPLPYNIIPPDGLLHRRERKPLFRDVSAMTLVMASCDPAAGLLASMMGEKAGIRVLCFHRSSHESLSLLKQGVVHVAGTHLREISDSGGNKEVVMNMLGKDFRLIRGAVWHEGIAVRSVEGLKSIKKATSPAVRWIGRKEGSGARRCQDKILSTGRELLGVARNHWEVAMAVNQGWVDAGICHRLMAEEAGLDFMLVSKETFDLCYPVNLEDDPRIIALRKIIKSTGYRKSLSGFRGIETGTSGDEISV
ncbi:MAG: helix-turn-helix domain-containing protein [Deltaproteobacteria bacterium]|nr:helix-turn-helix domain-containing protein [Deltaproteobacteria bacterium]